VEPVDYVNARLTGRICATQTTAFPLMLVDNRVYGNTAYDAELVQRAGVEPDKLPPIVAYDEIIGNVTAEAADHLGITTGAVVVTGTIDSITSAVGCGVLDRTACSVIVGTTTVIVTHIEGKDGDLAHGLISVPSPVPGRYFVMAENGVGGRALDVFVHNIAYAEDAMAVGPIPEDAFERAEATAATIPVGSEGVLFFPWLVGSMAPAANGHVRGGFLNLTVTTSRAHLARAVYEGVALTAAWLLPHVAAFAGADWPSVRFGGGGAASGFWAQVLADAFGRDVEQLAGSQTTNARGAAFLALARLGHIALADVPQLLTVTRRYRPDADHHAVYRRLGEHFVDFHARSQPFFAALNDRAVLTQKDRP
jgi:xylulokinase